MRRLVNSTDLFGGSSFRVSESRNEGQEGIAATDSGDSSSRWS